MSDFAWYTSQRGDGYISSYKARFSSWMFFLFRLKKDFTNCRKQLFAFNFVIYTIDVHRKIFKVC